ncbi:MAG: hypothetical protein JXR76_08545 [Deltaproteobacteria bacterium]|nr:hypothetical protein [Deltaproteobacteria bacterium]
MKITSRFYQLFKWAVIGLGLQGMALLMVACDRGGDDTAPECVTRTDCQTGKCVQGVCVPDSSSSEDSASEPPSSDTSDTSGDTTDTHPQETDSDSADTALPINATTQTDYIQCNTDEDCLSEPGNCITSVNSGTPFSGASASLPLSSVFPNLTGSGVCSLDCTLDESVCQSLTVVDARGKTHPFVCQLVAAGASPYPEQPGDFPYDNQIDTAAMAAGQAFSAICRPPFAQADTVPSSFCRPCLKSSECSDGICWRYLSDAKPDSDQRGLCLMQCSDAGNCPAGFSCDVAQNDATYCRPDENTCSSCRDLDGDTYGVGHCGARSDGLSPVDCDDTNPLAYFNPHRMDHPFPDACGAFDYNCNGLSDDAEQIGADAYNSFHCGGCYNVCGGESEGTADANAAVSACSYNASAQTGECRISCNDANYADCDGDVVNGCETAIGENLWFPDNDQDGRGFAADSALENLNDYFYCAGAAPEGYVKNAWDVDDTQPASAGTPCSTGNPGICSDGLLREVDGNILCEGIEPGTFADDDCDNVDDDCDGEVDEHYLPVACTIEGISPPCDEGKIECINGQLACMPAFVPVSEVPDDGKDGNCDGFDGDKEAVFVAPGLLSDNGDGTMENPFTSLKDAITEARIRGVDVYAASGTLLLEENVRLKNGVGIYGGYRRFPPAGEEAWSLDIDGAGVVQSRSIFVAPATDGDSDKAIIALDLFYDDRTTEDTDTETDTATDTATGTPSETLGIIEETWLKNISVYTQYPADPGVSVYGIRCKNCPELRMKNVLIQMSDGSDGNSSTNNATAYGFNSDAGLWTGAQWPSSEVGGSSIAILLFDHPRRPTFCDAGDKIGISRGSGGEGIYGGVSIGILHNGAMEYEPFDFSVETGTPTNGDGTSGLQRKIF